jgi:hypothetical protein
MPSANEDRDTDRRWKARVRRPPFEALLPIIIDAGGALRRDAGPPSAPRHPTGTEARGYPDVDVLAADADVTLPHGDPKMVAILACAFVRSDCDEGRRAQVSVRAVT